MSEEEIYLSRAFPEGGYRDLLQNIIDVGHSFVTSDVLHQEPRRGRVWMRHDVEISCEEALPMAHVETELGIRATYFLCPESPLTPIEAARALARELQAMNHEVGLHLVATDSDDATALALKRLRLAPEIGLDVGCAVTLHAPHIRSREALAVLCPTPYVYHSQRSDGWRYLSDATGSWRSGSPLDPGILDDQPVQILTHPFWWFGVERLVTQSILRAWFPQLALLKEKAGSLNSSNAGIVAHDPTDDAKPLAARTEEGAVVTADRAP